MCKKAINISAVFRARHKLAEFQIKHKIGENSFIRKRKLTFDKIMTMIFKKSNKSIQNSINDMQLNLGDDYTITNSAFSQARAKINYTAFEEFARVASELFYEDGEYGRHKHFRLLAIDGSIVRLPNSDDIKKEFNPTKVTCQVDDFQKEIVQARMSCLYDVINGIAIDFDLVNYVKSDTNDIECFSEKDLALNHLEYCNEDDLVIMDRGYPSYELFARTYNKTNVLFRIRSNSFSKAKPLFSPHCENKDIVCEINAPKYLKEELRLNNLPTKLKVRFIQVKLDNGQIEVLATNVLDNEILQTSDFKSLYAKRWEIETFYNLLKNRLSLENFTGLTALAVKQDFYATIFLSNYESSFVYDLNLELKEKKKNCRYIQKINKATSFNAIKHELFNLFYTNKSIHKIERKIEKLLLTSTITKRPNRKTKPRLDKEKDKTTIATNAINFLKRKKKNIGN